MPEILALTDDDRGHWTVAGAPRPVRTTLWRPAGSHPAPLVLLSHGTAGSAAELGWLAEALAANGYAVAGVDHHGNTCTEPYVAEGFAFAWERPRDLTVVLDALAADPGIDLSRVGVAGFSVGGYTAAALLGARLAPRRLRILFDTLTSIPLPEYPDLADELLDRYGPALVYAIPMAACQLDVADPRVRAGYLIEPSMGNFCDPASLATVKAPLRVVTGGPEDDPAWAGGVGQPYRELVVGATGRGLGRDVSHDDFLADRSLQDTVAGDALEFFGSTLL